jgi:hypothetical protein
VLYPLATTMRPQGENWQQDVVTKRVVLLEAPNSSTTGRRCGRSGEHSSLNLGKTLREIFEDCFQL